VEDMGYKSEGGQCLVMTLCDYNMLVFLVISFHCSFAFGVQKGYVELFLMHP
jgi:hypothetical protein